VADYLKEPLVREEGFKSDRVHFIPNGIDGSFYQDPPPRSELLDELGLDESNKLVGIVARLDPIKNHALLINAMKEVHERIPEARLIVVGDGPLSDELEQQTSELNVKDVVIFMGERGDVPRILSGLDLFVLSSLSEGMSITLVEAMAAGLPIVVTDVGGNPSIISSEENGTIVPSDDREALSEAITRLLNDEVNATQLGVKARKRFEEEFTLEKMVDRHRKLYEE
jgi:glycosyltransferase involved in cell wall biosynthesis